MLYRLKKIDRAMTLSGFTLIELSVVLMIIGIIAGAVFKGQDLLEAAKIRSILNDINRYRLAISSYQETYNSLPGDDPNASTHFGAAIPNGNGDGIINGLEKNYFWQHLHLAGQTHNSVAPSSKLGGKYTIVYQPSENFSGHWIQLGKENSDIHNDALFTPKQAQSLKSKAEEGGNLDPLQGDIRFIEGQGIPKGQCVRDTHLNLETKFSACILLARF